MKCKDCGSTSRKLLRPGPRCASCLRALRKARREAAHEARVQKVYGLAPGEYEALYAAQGGVCAGCLRATGRTKRLAVDHDHKTGQPRGLLCGPCNQMLGHGRDDPEFFRRVAGYLEHPPYAILTGTTHTKDLRA